MVDVFAIGETEFLRIGSQCFVIMNISSLKWYNEARVYGGDEDEDGETTERIEVWGHVSTADGDTFYLSEEEANELERFINEKTDDRWSSS